MNSNHDLVWYVCYGSNLLKSRFLCYIQGGQIPGNTRSERGAKDKSLPLRSEPYIISHELFFSYHISKWEGSGVAFINPARTDGTRTYGRKYLITESQFWDVVRQENAVAEDTDIEIDYARLHADGSVILFHDNYYGRILYLGDSDGFPMYTFTCIPSMEELKKTPLCGSYYDVIAEGLKETHHLSDKEVEAYLAPFTQV